MKKIIYILLLSLVISQDEQLSDYHISLSLHENLINDFFSNMGDIEGEAFRKNIATGKAMSIGVNPDLA